MFLSLSISSSRTITIIIGLITIAVFVIGSIILIIMSKQKAAKSLEHFKQAILKAKSEIDPRYKYQVKGLIFDPKLIDITKLKVAFNSQRLDNGAIFVEEILDLKKLKGLEPFKAENITIEIDNSALIITTNEINYFYFWKDIFYFKGYYSFAKQALFLEPILYNGSKSIIFQLTTFEEINLINKFKFALKNQK